MNPVAGESAADRPLSWERALPSWGDIAATVSHMQAHGMPLATFPVWPAALVELVGSALLPVGWQMRGFALALAAFTAAATPIFFTAVGWRPIR